MRSRKMIHDADWLLSTAPTPESTARVDAVVYIRFASVSLARRGAPPGR